MSDRLAAALHIANMIDAGDRARGFLPMEDRVLMNRLLTALGRWSTTPMDEPRNDTVIAHMQVSVLLDGRIIGADTGKLIGYAEDRHAKARNALYSFIAAFGHCEIRDAEGKVLAERPRPLAPNLTPHDDTQIALFQAWLQACSALGIKPPERGKSDGS